MTGDSIAEIVFVFIVHHRRRRRGWCHRGTYTHFDDSVHVKKNVNIMRRAANATLAKSGGMAAESSVDALQAEAILEFARALNRGEDKEEAYEREQKRFQAAYKDRTAATKEPSQSQRVPAQAHQVVAHQPANANLSGGIASRTDTGSNSSPKQIYRAVKPLAQQHAQPHFQAVPANQVQPVQQQQFRPHAPQTIVRATEPILVPGVGENSPVAPSIEELWAQHQASQFKKLPQQKLQRELARGQSQEQVASSNPGQEQVHDDISDSTAAIREDAQDVKKSGREESPSAEPTTVAQLFSSNPNIDVKPKDTAKTPAEAIREASEKAKEAAAAAEEAMRIALEAQAAAAASNVKVDSMSFRRAAQAKEVAEAAAEAAGRAVTAEQAAAVKDDVVENHKDDLVEDHSSPEERQLSFRKAAGLAVGTEAVVDTPAELQKTFLPPPVSQTPRPLFQRMQQQQQVVNTMQMPPQQQQVVNTMQQQQQPVNMAQAPPPLQQPANANFAQTSPMQPSLAPTQATSQQSQQGIMHSEIPPQYQTAPNKRPQSMVAPPLQVLPQFPSPQLMQRHVEDIQSNQLEHPQPSTQGQLGASLKREGQMAEFHE